METNIHTYGRTELAQQYFPKMNAQAAWFKLRQWLTLNPDTRPLLQTGRRSFTPAEVALIFDRIGEP